MVGLERTSAAHGDHHPSVVVFDPGHGRAQLHGVAELFGQGHGHLVVAALDPIDLDSAVGLVVGRRVGGDHEQLRQASDEGRVHLIGAVDEEDLSPLYSSAAAFICMSHYEGFCLPLLEAMTASLPILTSNRSALPEVAGDAADKEALTEAIQQTFEAVVSAIDQ